ncbi:hypothetical protein ACROYT_G014590 [Oculina patagonica]
MHDNKLLLNEDKTEFLLIGTKQQLAKVNTSHITVGNANIVPQSPVKNLGVWLDSNLSMVDHITKTSSAAFYHLYNIRRIRSPLPGFLEAFRPKVFKDAGFADTEALGNATETWILQSENFDVNNITFSNYKNHTTRKTAIWIYPHGGLLSCSETYPGTI